MSFLIGTHLFGIINSQPLTASLPDSPSSENEFSLPTVILWNPLVTYSEFFCDDSFVCQTCSRQLCHSHWNDGSSSNKQPRLVHDTSNIVLLVSSVYTCDNGHILLAHDTRVLDIQPSKTAVPFVLMHRTGFTRTFLNMVEAYCQTGMNFHSLEAAVANIRWQNFEERKNAYLDTHKMLTKNDQRVLQFPSFEDTAGKFLPSDNILRDCFVAKFLENEKNYKLFIQSLNTAWTNTKL